MIHLKEKGIWYFVDDVNCKRMLLVATSWASETWLVQPKGCIAIMQRDGIVWTPVPPSPIDGITRHAIRGTFRLFFCTALLVWNCVYWFFRNLLNHLIKDQNHHSPLEPARYLIFQMYDATKILYLCVILMWLLIPDCRKCNSWSSWIYRNNKSIV